MKHLVIVESPTKAKTISKFLPRNYKVTSSYGHVRDLPAKELAVDVDNNYKPTYAVPEKAMKQVKKLKDMYKTVDHLILATDDDREGEAISWHLEQILKPKEYDRIAFHEITKPAIEKALTKPRKINMDLVDAQQARRVLDRLVGYKLSPFLWSKVARGLSAGRVQSVCVRLIVEKERERDAFNIEEYWTIEAEFTKSGLTEVIGAKLNAINGKSLKKLEITNEQTAKKILADLDGAKFKVASIEKKQTKKKPPTPFKTSTLQQTANNKLHFSAKQTMMLAQQLYEGIKLDGEQVGLITYMRTDSLALADSFLKDTNSFIKKAYGDDYAPAKPVVYKTKAKGAQEAHEAIRPTSVHRTPEQMRPFLDERQYKVYNLIWSRTVASQMTEAVIDATGINIEDDKQQYQFRANGQTVKFPGFYAVYSSTKEHILPAIKEGDDLDAKSITPEQHYTQPPARYTEATLVKMLEEHGIGRPSTYAPTIATVQTRGYVIKEERALRPTDMAMLVNDILVKHFPKIVDLEFTANMENLLDEIEEGKKEWKPVIGDFYKPFIKNLEKKDKELDKKELTEQPTDEKCEKCKSPMIIKTGRYGRFMACSNYPECKHTFDIDKDGEKVHEEVIEEKCPDCSKDLERKHGRFGEFIGCSSYPECKYIQKKEIKTGVSCPKCGVGEIVEKRTRKGKIFFACNKYPDCEQAFWNKPTGAMCKLCDEMIVEAGKDKTKCSNKECEASGSKKKPDDDKDNPKSKKKKSTKKK